MSKLELLKSNMTRKLEDIVTEMSCNNMTALLNLSYELLKLESDCKTEKEKFVKEMLEGNVKPAILVDIICSNTWSKQNSQMVSKASKYFNLVMNKSDYLIYKKKGLGPQSLSLSESLN